MRFKWERKDSEREVHGKGSVTGWKAREKERRGKEQGRLERQREGEAIQPPPPGGSESSKALPSSYAFKSAKDTLS